MGLDELIVTSVCGWCVTIYRQSPICSLISLYALKTVKVETIPYECWMDEIAVR